MIITAKDATINPNEAKIKELEEEVARLKAITKDSYENFIKNIYGKLVGDKGYISAKLFERLFVDVIQMITKIKKNKKNVFIPYADKILLCKRAVIESVNDELNNICQIEHSRRRSFANFITNLLAGIAAYSFLPKKPSINVKMEFDNALTLF